MTEKQMITELKSLVSLHGAATVAAKLNYRNQGSIEKWIREKKIPKARLDAVKLLIEREKTA